MVCYCPIRKILYLHIPKTGGLTIEKILVQYYGFKYFTFSKRMYQFLYDRKGRIGIFRYILENSNESKLYDLKSFFKFSFVRDPYDRSISCIRYLHGYSKKHLIEFPMNLNSLYQKSLTDNYFYMHFYLTQAASLKDDDDKIDFQFIGKFENLICDLEHVLFDILKFEIRDFSKVHVNASDKETLCFDNDDIYKLTEQIHDEDFILFNFKKKFD